MLTVKSNEFLQMMLSTFPQMLRSISRTLARPIFVFSVLLILHGVRRTKK